MTIKILAIRKLIMLANGSYQIGWEVNVMVDIWTYNVQNSF